MSFYPICEASGCLTFNNKDTNMGNVEQRLKDGMIQSMELILTVFSRTLHSYKPQIQPNIF